MSRKTVSLVLFAVMLLAAVSSSLSTLGAEPELGGHAATNPAAARGRVLHALIGGGRPKTEGTVPCRYDSRFSFRCSPSA